MTEKTAREISIRSELGAIRNQLEVLSLEADRLELDALSETIQDAADDIAELENEETYT